MTKKEERRAEAAGELLVLNRAQAEQMALVLLGEKTQSLGNVSLSRRLAYRLMTQVRVRG